MNRIEILEKMNFIFREVLENELISITDDTIAGVIEEWDSLSNIEIIVAIEKEFNIKFTSAEIENWKTVGEMCRDIQKKCG